MGNVTVIKKDNFAKFEKQLKGNKKLVFTAFGEKWKTIATNLITERNIVDTGEMRRTVDYFVGVDELTVGSPKLYAKFQENGKKGGFLKDSVLSYKDVYQNLIIKILRNGLK